MSTFGAAATFCPAAQAALAKRAQVQYTKHVYFHGSVHVAQGEFAYVRQFAHAVLSYGRAPVGTDRCVLPVQLPGLVHGVRCHSPRKGRMGKPRLCAKPFCIIYGFGAMLGYALLRPFAGNYVVLYVVGAVAATAFEYLTALLMLRLFGTFWWDYTNKPFNYRGIICLESTLGWGLVSVRRSLLCKTAYSPWCAAFRRGRAWPLPWCWWRCMRPILPSACAALCTRRPQKRRPPPRKRSWNHDTACIWASGACGCAER